MEQNDQLGADNGANEQNSENTNSRPPRRRQYTTGGEGSNGEQAGGGEQSNADQTSASTPTDAPATGEQSGGGYRSNSGGGYKGNSGGGYRGNSGGEQRSGGYRSNTGGEQRSGGGFRSNSGGGGYKGGSGGQRSGGGYKGGGGQRSGGYSRGPQDRNQRRPLSDAEKKMYYVTLLCPLAIDEQIDIYKQAVKSNFACEVAAKSPAHITLITPFFLSDSKYMELTQKLEEFESIITEVDVNIEGFNFFGKRVIFADVHVNDNLAALQEQVENYLKNSGFPFIREAKKPYHPHVTIATRDLKEEDFDAAWSMFEGKSFSASFSTNAIHIMKLVDDKWVHDKEFILK